MPAASWLPLLNSEDTDVARQSALAIADSIAERHDRICARQSEPRSAWAEGSLGEGTAGLSLFFAYLALDTQRVDHRALAEQLADESVDHLVGNRVNSSLYCGFSGTAWLIRHLGDMWGDPDAPAYTEEIDIALSGALASAGWNAEFDLISGLVGLGVYALEGLPDRQAIWRVERVVEHLDLLAQWNVKGVTWFTAPRLLDLDAREACPDGYHNLGVAHGVPGIIGFLARAAAAGIARERAERLAHGAVDWLLAQTLGPESPSLFPSFVLPGKEPKPSRLAWCYGDSGVASTLLAAASSLDEPSWREAALKIARHAATRRPETANVNDGCLCHGAAGVAHMFNRMFQVSGEEVLREAAITWFRRLLDLREKEIGIGGFRAWTAAGKSDGVYKHEDRIGFLTGASGIGLALLAAISSQPPGWDRAMLLSGSESRVLQI
ncbi:MAG TPA: lanthionine synthetase C family protein [Thermoanaerobaculia bacterium]|nr:lanthionine synthetase C family protein [Thermoanaerobaculia bacterium]